MNTISLIDRCDLEAYGSWRRRRVAPAYMRGLPTWVWQSAVDCRPRRGRARPAVA